MSLTAVHCMLYFPRAETAKSQRPIFVPSYVHDPACSCMSENVAESGNVQPWPATNILL